MAVAAPPYEKMNGQDFLAVCKEKGVKPACRGRKKTVVIEELRALERDTAGIQKTQKKVAKEGLTFMVGRKTNDAIWIVDSNGGQVAMFVRKGNPLNADNPKIQPFETYATWAAEDLTKRMRA